MANILFVHNNFPAQFVGIAAALRRAGHRCAAIGSRTAGALLDIPVSRWSTDRGTTKGIWPDAIRTEADMIRARAAADVALALKTSGFEPDLVIGHPGWGETLLLREVFPRARQILLAEFFYRTEGGDVGFDPEFGPLTFAERFRVHSKNAALALAYAEADRLVCPTAFQAGTLPSMFRPRTTVIHEGVDTEAIRPMGDARLPLPNGRVLARGSEVVTFVNRCFEPLRGFHVFMRALPDFLAARPDAQVVMIGAEQGKVYGRPAAAGRSWKDQMLAELGPLLDLSRVHFIGRVPPHVLHAALSLSTAHVYYTYPFVLSWSLLEAMACESLIIGSDTAPVRDALEHGRTGLLQDFFDVTALSSRLIEACAYPEAYRSLRTRAREVVCARFDRNRTSLPAWLSLVAEVL